MRRTLSLVLLLVFALRSLLPAGFMLQASPAHGRLEVVICTGHGPERLAPDEAEKPSPPKPAKSDTGVCPFSMASGSAIAAASPAPLDHVVHYAALSFTVAREHFRASPRPSANTARAPPLA